MAANIHSRKALSSEEIERTFASMRKHGNDRMAVAQELGLSYQGICARLRRLGFVSGRGRPPKPVPIVLKPATKSEEINVALLWDRYTKQRDIVTRNQLVQFHLPLATTMALALQKKCPIDFDTLQSAAQEGLIGAVEKFEPGRGLKFGTYAGPRIYGAMIDEMRKIDHVPRLTRTRAKRVEAARRRITDQQGRNATDDEIAAELKLNPLEMREGMPRGLDSLEQMTFSSPDKDSRVISARDTIADSDADRPATAWGRDQLFRDMTRGCTLMEQTILWLYHIHGTTMKQIGVVLDLSESRVSQLHSGILDRLRKQHERTEAWATYRALVG